MESKINTKLLSMAGQGGSAFGIELMSLAEAHDNLMVLSADMSTPAGLDKFKAAHPDRFINVGIAEQNMLGIAAGLTEEGFKTICVAQACFITMRSFEQVRQYTGYMGIPLILVGIGSGVSLQYMGNTHYALEDIALMRTIPGMTVICPADALEAMKALKDAVCCSQPTYIRFFGGTGIPTVYNQDYDFQIGKGIKLMDGCDVQIIATGSMVVNALKAADILEEKGLRTSVVNMHTIKPIDTSIIDLSCHTVVIIEEHHIIGGLGSAVAEWLAGKPQHPPLVSIGIEDAFPPVGSYPYIIGKTGLSPEGIAEIIIKETNTNY